MKYNTIYLITNKNQHVHCLKDISQIKYYLVIVIYLKNLNR